MTREGHLGRCSQRLARRATYMSEKSFIGQSIHQTTVNLLSEKPISRGGIYRHGSYEEGIAVIKISREEVSQQPKFMTETAMERATALVKASGITPPATQNQN